METNTQQPVPHNHMPPAPPHAESGPMPHVRPEHGPTPPPPKPKVGATDFFLHFGFIVAFYTFLGTIVSFVFSIINTLYPDRQYNYYDPYASGMRTSVAILIVATPLVLILLRKIYQNIKKEPVKKDLWVRKWGLYLTLTLSIIALAIDLVVLIDTYLGGEISTRFVLKALTVIILGVLVWLFTRREIHDSMANSPKAAQGVTWGTVAVILALVITGISYIGSPALLRNIRDDNKRESDIESISYRVLSYYQSKDGKLPATLAEISVGDPYASPMPTDPATKGEYEYKVLPDVTVAGAKFPAYAICTTFAEDGNADKRVQNSGRGGETSPSLPLSDKSLSYPDYPYYDNQRFSEHPKGYKCFDLSIDPVRYKPYNSSVMR